MTDETNNNNQVNPENVVTLTDLQNVLVVMDLASSRGAFRGAELQPVGQLYDKINKFLQAAMPQAAPQDGAASGAGESASEATGGATA